MGEWQWLSDWGFLFFTSLFFPRMFKNLRIPTRSLSDMSSVLALVCASAASTAIRTFPYEKIVTTKLLRGRHSTRVTLSEVGVVSHETAGTALPIDTITSNPMFLDESAALIAASFPIDESILVEKAKTFLYYAQGVEKPEMLSESFVFMGPFVGGEGGLPKADYLKAVGGFEIKKAFPDLNPRFHHFRADPLDPGRIWFTSQASGTDAGEGFLGNKPTGKAFLTPPQACSIKFNAEGEVTKYTIGHVMERSIGNTGGLGGVFGPAYAIGKPLPFREANPWKPSLRYRALMQVGKLLTWLNDRKASRDGSPES